MAPAKVTFKVGGKDEEVLKQAYKLADAEKYKIYIKRNKTREKTKTFRDKYRG